VSDHAAKTLLSGPAAVVEPVGMWGIYLRGISTGDFREALSALLGPDAPNLSPSVISRLTTGWENEHETWQRRDLSVRRYVYIWADGVYPAPPSANS